MAEYKEKYGRQLVEALVKKCASYSWMEENCVRCPACDVKITVSIRMPRNYIKLLQTV